ncbi:MAG: hypothetical protein Q9162_005219 [Coniocarpon cinnabarinum]
MAAILQRLGRLLYSIALIYFAACTFAKLSILALYRRVFTSQWTRVATWILIALVIANWIATSIPSAAQCVPVSMVFNPKIHGKCINLKAFYKYSNLPALIIDVPMLLLPIPSCLRLHATWPRKLGLIFIFICGGLGMIASIVRFAIFLTHDTFSEPSYTFRSFVGWSIIEPGFYLIAACLLSIYPLAQQLSTQTKGLFNTLTGRKPEPASDSYRMTNIPASQGRSKGFATLPGEEGDEEELVDYRTFFKRNGKTQAESPELGPVEIEGIQVRRDIWVTEGTGR